MDLKKYYVKTEDYECLIKSEKNCYVIFWDTIFTSIDSSFDDEKLYSSFTAIAAKLFRDRVLYYHDTKDGLYGICCLLAGESSRITGDTKNSYVSTNYANIRILKKINGVALDEQQLKNYFDLVVNFLNKYFYEKKSNK